MAPDYILKALEEPAYNSIRPTDKVVWLGNSPVVENFTKSKKGNQREMCSITFYGKKETLTIKTEQKQGWWLAAMLEKLSVKNIKTYTLQQIRDSYEAEVLDDFELFWDNKPVSNLYKVGLLKL